MKFSDTCIGFENVWDTMHKFHDTITKNIPNYPPYNVKKIDDNNFEIEVAVAGFSRSNINLELDGGTLRVTGKTEVDKSNFLVRGIAGRSFERLFTLADTIEIKNANLVNGMLKISLEKIIPKYKKPTKIKLDDPENNY